MTLIKELIDIPGPRPEGDFVLRLAEGVNDPAETLATTSSRPSWPSASTTP